MTTDLVDASFNPYFVGSQSLRWLRMTTDLVDASFNPYFVGSQSLSVVDCGKTIILHNVSIHILLEVNR